MIKKISIFIIMFLIWLILFFSFNLFFKKNKIENLDLVLPMHNWKMISDILTIDNYNKIWINPDTYVDFKSFLTDFKSFSWVSVNPITEKFVIWINSGSWNIIFTPFDFKNTWYVFDNNTNKDLAILDIFKAYKNNLIYWWIDSEYWNKILFEEDLQHPKTNELRKIFDVNLNDKTNNVFNIIDWLNKSEEIWVSNNELLAYLYDFTWDYDKASEKRNEICKKYNVTCDKKINLEVSWTIYDIDWKTLSWVKVELLNNNNIFSVSDLNWKFTINFSHFPFSHLRFKSSLIWFSDWFSTVSLNKYDFENDNININFKLQKADNSFVINNDNKLDFKKWKYYIIETEYSKYYVPIDALYYMNWEKYTKNNFNVYTYLFKKSSNMDSLLENDTFEPVYWYVWNIMKTFGMPYIQFVDVDSREELYIKSSNPMILQNQIYHMKELYENSDWIYQEVTDEDMKFLVQKSEELWWYPIDFDFLTKNNFLRWPAWWALDRKTWIWSNVWSRVLNVGGLMELPFYHIKDN